MDSATTTLTVPKKRKRKRSSGERLAFLLSPHAIDDDLAVNNYQKFLLISAHYQLRTELKTEITNKRYVPDPTQNKVWLAMCYERAQQIAANIERLSFAARLKLFTEFQGAALYSHLGYNVLSEWAVAQADLYKGDGPRWEHRFIGEQLIPFCQQHDIFDSPKALAEWLAKPSFLYRTRQILAEIKRIIERVPTIADKVFAIKALFTMVENPDIKTSQLREVASGGIKAPIKVEKVGSLYLVSAFLTEDQLNSFISRNGFAMIIDKT